MELRINPVHEAGAERTVRSDRREKGVRQGAGEERWLQDISLSLLNSYMIFVYLIKHKLKFYRNIYNIEKMGCPSLLTFN